MRYQFVVILYYKYPRLKRVVSAVVAWFYRLCYDIAVFIHFDQCKEYSFFLSAEVFPLVKYTWLNSWSSLHLSSQLPIAQKAECKVSHNGHKTKQTDVFEVKQVGNHSRGLFNNNSWHTEVFFILYIYVI